jgi:hypothetical protein
MNLDTTSAAADLSAAPADLTAAAPAVASAAVASAAIVSAARPRKGKPAPAVNPESMRDILAPAATGERIKPIPYDERQALAIWTAKDGEGKANALWLGIAPLVSAFLVNGGTRASLEGKGKGQSKLALFIHGEKGKRNNAARAAFAQCLAEYKPRACEFDQTAHDDAIEALEVAFLQALAPAAKGKGKPAKDKRYTVAELVDAIASGALSAADLSAIVGALPPSALTAAPAAPAAAEGSAA